MKLSASARRELMCNILPSSDIMPRITDGKRRFTYRHPPSDQTGVTTNIRKTGSDSVWGYCKPVLNQPLDSTENRSRIFYLALSGKLTDYLTERSRLIDNFPLLYSSRNTVCKIYWRPDLLCLIDKNRLCLRQPLSNHDRHSGLIIPAFS